MKNQETIVNATKVGEVDLYLPVVLYFDGAVTVDSGIALKAIGMRFVNECTMLCKEHSRGELPGWLIELNGNFREFLPKSKRHEWARSLSFLWRFTLSEYEVSFPREITVGELTDRIKNIKERSREAPIVTDLKRFLEKFKREDVVTKEMLLDWPIL